MAACDMEQQQQYQHEQDIFSPPGQPSPIQEGFMQKFRLYQTLSVIMHLFILGLIKRVKYIDWGSEGFRGT